MKTTVTFNTERHYTAEGQIITACWDDEEEELSFVDHARDICGVMWRSSRAMSDRPSHIAGELMRHYDRGDYISVGAWQLKDVCVRQEKVHHFDL